jgi:hypothetical protein
MPRLSKLIDDWIVYRRHIRRMTQTVLFYSFFRV